MVNYQNGKIYKIVSNTDDDICYVGSTTKKYLSQRMDTHRNNYKRENKKHNNTSAFELFEKYGIENCRIELLEIYPCNTKDELIKKEGQHIKILNCVNKRVEGRTKKEYYQDNKAKISERKKIYHQKNKKQLSEKDKLKYQKNKDKHKQKYICCCGSLICNYGKSQHEKSKKHMDFITSQVIV